MDNPIKNIIAYHTQENREVSLTRIAFQTLKRDVSNFFWVERGFDNPTDVLSCWYVNEKDRVESLKNQKPFSENYSSSEYFKITKRLDNSFIEGYLGRKDTELTYHNDFARQYTYFEDYTKRNKVYFTFDKISLYQVMEILPENPLKFIMKRLDNIKAFKKNQAFMIMPFHNKELDKFYFEKIKPFLKEKLSIDIYRADDFRDNDIIVQTIYNLIEESEFVIGDTTHDNKNAFYELGYASAIGKEIITIQNKLTEQKLFFDRAHIRSIMYDTTNIESFEFDLDSTIKSIRDRQ